jgi:hypothetical protein
MDRDGAFRCIRDRGWNEVGCCLELEARIFGHVKFLERWSRRGHQGPRFNLTNVFFYRSVGRIFKMLLKVFSLTKFILRHR